jgi:hypothetical protein
MTKARNTILFLVIALVTTAYLIRAIGKAGVWGGIFFVVIWLAVFLNERRRT